MVERWEKLVFLSPSKVQSVLDFKAQNSFSKRRVWWYSLRSFFPRQKESGQNHYTELFEYHLDGQAVFFFFGRCCQGPLNVCKSALTVSEVWDCDRNWSLNKLSFVIPGIISDTIHATPKPFQSNLANLPTQNLSPNGQFNSNTAYALSKNSLTAPLAQTWKWIWKIPTISRIQTLPRENSHQSSTQHETDCSRCYLPTLPLQSRISSLHPKRLTSCSAHLGPPHWSHLTQRFRLQQHIWLV